MIPRKEVSEDTQKDSYYETEALTSIKQKHKNMGYRHTPAVQYTISIW